MLFGVAPRELPVLRRGAVAAAFLVLLSSPATADERPPPASLAEEIERGLSTEGAGDGVVEGAAGRSAEVLRAFYLDRDLAPVWVTAGGPGPRAETLAAILAAAAEDGLDPAAYELAAIRDLLPLGEAAALARLELKLSRAFLRFLSDLGGGRARDLAAGGAVPAPLVAPLEPIDQAALLAGAANAEDLAAFVAGARPRGARYAALRQALGRYRQVAADGGWEAVPAGVALRLGSIDPRIPALRRRLALSGDLRPAARGPSALFDQALAAAVRRAQQRHGLEPDGVVGPDTLAALNRPVAKRITQLVLNLERLRWMPQDLGEDFVEVNLAAARLRLVEDGKERLGLRIAAGRPYHGTPIFSQALTSIVFSPDWTVPPGIVGAELLPILREDPGYLARNGFSLFSDWTEEAKPLDPASVDWSVIDGAALSYKLRQAPGPENPLGRISFVFPNDFGVCLHDTPASASFADDGQDFSLGCIRVESPEILAEALLAGAAGWSQDRIAEVLAEGTPTAVGLPDPVPIHVAYLTAWAEGKAVHFRDDVFGRDAALAETLLGQGG